MVISQVTRATTLEPHEIVALQHEVRALARERRPVILADNYQRPEVQDVADFVGDSLASSRKAAESDAELIAFCGVDFMADCLSFPPAARLLRRSPPSSCAPGRPTTLRDRRHVRQHLG